ncbi:MAG: D-2-hydroxyacid dehydrogenase family protein [Pseudomonadota bacterium]|nr:D-2-hydroxyacid dehydrogenase family protein [Pseudomonadota bacterium]
MSARPRVVVLDDYEQLLRKSGDWASVDALADVVVHPERLRGESLLAAIRDADAIVVIRDRTPFKAELLAQLPKLRFFSFTGGRNTTMDAAAFKARGIPVTNTEMGSSKEGTAELAWALILAAAKRLEAYLALVRRGQWRDGKGLPAVLAGERLGIIGFGDIGQRVGRVGQAFGMELVCWSPNMTPERAAQGGAKSVTLEELLKTSKVVSLSLVPSEATRKLLNAERLALMRRDSILVNTARSALIDMAALDAALEQGRPGIAALDVYDDEPLAAGAALARRDNVVLTPHLGFVSEPVFARFGPGVVENLLAWLRDEPQPRLVKSS